MPDSPDKGATGALGIILKLNDAPVDDSTMIASVRITKDIGRIPEAVVAVQSDGAQIEDFSEIDSDDFKIGSDVQIEAFYGDEAEKVLFVGVVTNTRLRLDGQRGTTLELLCRDEALKLMNVRSSNKYDEMKDSEVINAIISDAGLTGDITATTVKWDQLRVDTSDWDFLRLLADRNGLTVNVEAGKVTVKEPDTSGTAALTVTLGVDMLAYDAVVDTQRMIAKSEHSAWDSVTQEIVSGLDDTLTDATLGNSKAADVATVMNDRHMKTPVGAETTSAALKSLSKSRTLRASLDAIHGNCTFVGSGEIAPGDLLEIKDAGTRFTGKAYVSGVTHTISGGTWTTQTRLGLPLDWVSDTAGLASVPASGIATPVPGLQIGVVTKLTEDPDNKDRIQVKLPLFGGDDDTLIWARFGTPYATGDAGFQFLPEIDDEVLIGFIHDDPNAAVILGSLHNGNAARPVEATEDNFLKTIQTPEKLKIEFDDENKILTFETPGGHSITMDDDGAMIALADSNGNTITMDADGITLKSDSDIVLDAGGNVDVTATQDATITGMNVTCDADTGFTGKGGATAELSAGGNTTVEGAMVMIN